jgi:membrane-anchored glycerophosphoryl diester phosphodiesterase (GDPDase)
MKEKINYSDIFRAAWKGLKSQFWLLTGLLIGFTIIYSLLFIFATPAKGESFGISGIIICILSSFLLCLFQLGYLKNCFQTLDGEEPQFSSYGQMSRKLISYIVASLIFMIIISIGFALLVIPGIYLSLRLQFFFASMVDENTGIIGSLKRSWEITKGQSIRLFAVMLIMILISFAGQIALFVGIFIAVPLIILMYGVVFRRLTTLAA